MLGLILLGGSQKKEDSVWLAPAQARQSPSLSLVACAKSRPGHWEATVWLGSGGNQATAKSKEGQRDVAASGRLPLTRGAKCVGNCAQFTCSPLRVSLPPFVDHVGLPLPPPSPSLFSSGLQSYDRIPLSLALRLKKPVFSVHLSATATPPVLRLITMI